jgi:protein TonB
MLCAGRGSYAYQLPKGGVAVDVNGKRHTGKEYPKYEAPWNFADRIATVAPTYPLKDRASRHQGDGFFRIVIDPAHGTVAQVIILKSTRYESLDECAVSALRRWRWKPNTWREVEVPVTFSIAPRAGTTPPPNTIHLPP